MCATFRGRRFSAPQPVKVLPPKQEVTPDVLRSEEALLLLLQTQNERIALMSASLDALKSDVASLATEVTQAIALIQANAASAASAAADEAEITALEAQVTSLRDQLAAALAPVPPVAA